MYSAHLESEHVFDKIAPVGGVFDMLSIIRAFTLSCVSSIHHVCVCVCVCVCRAIVLALVPALELVTSSACTGSCRCWPVLFLLPDSLAVVMARDAGPVSWNLRWSNMNETNVLPEKH